MLSFWNILLALSALSTLFTAVSACGLIFRRPDALAYTNGDGGHYKPDGEYVKVNCNDCEIGKYQKIDGNNQYVYNKDTHDFLNFGDRFDQIVTHDLPEEAQRDQGNSNVNLVYITKSKKLRKDIADRACRDKFVKEHNCYVYHGRPGKGDATRVC